MFGLFRRRLSSGKKRPAPRSAKRQRPNLQVEVLEDRCTPTIDVVTTTADSTVPGSGSLRATIASATSGDTIMFASNVTPTITLNPAYGPITTNESLTITGPGAGVLTISGGGNTGIFYLTGTGNAAVTITGLTLMDGNNTVTGPNNGGAISSSGSLTLNNTVLSGNTSAGAGGAVHENGGSLKITNSVFRMNYATNGNGGAVCDYGGGDVYISNCTFSKNTTAYLGGAVYAGGGEVAINVVIQNSTITGNVAGTSFEGGGGGIGIINDGSNSISGCTFYENYAVGGNGGAVTDYGGPLNISNCSFSKNTAYNRGGAVYATDSFGFPNSAVVIQNSSISGNVAGTSIEGRGGGGGVCLNYTTGNTIYDCAIVGNTAYYGGGVLLRFAPAASVIQNCTIANNQATVTSPLEQDAIGGGGVLLYQGSLSIQNCTVTGNTAPNSNGGGIWVNTVYSEGGPIYGGAYLTLQSTIVSGNSDQSGPEDIGRYTGPSGANTINASNDLFSTAPTTGANGVINGTNSANLSNTDPLLGPLQNNGGPTDTMALSANSPAIDAGSNPANLTFDQRGVGFNRTIGDDTDIGAYEFQPAPTTTTLISSLNPVDVGQSVTFTATVAGTAANSNVPAGTVTFFDGSTALATATLNNGEAVFTTSSLSVGTHPITAVYNGENDVNTFDPSTSPVLNEVVESPTPPTPAVFAVGSDAGTIAEVKVYDAATDALIFDLHPFGTFSGGVRVALGDVNGDGVDDVICGAGPGGGPQVVVFDGQTGQMILSFYGLAPGFRGGVYVAAGDVTGSGTADIIVGAGAGGGSQVAVFSGKDGSLLESFYAFAPKFSGGVRVAAGDVNGDGIADIICAAGPGGGPQITVFNGVNLAILLSFEAFAANFTGGVFVAAGDVNGDGLADIIASPGAGGGPQITGFSGKDASVLLSFYDPRLGTLPTEPGISTGIRVGALTSNGPVEILATSGPGAPALLDVFNSQTLGLLDSFFAFDPSFQGGAFVGG